MLYRIYKLSFLNHVHFGKEALDDMELSFHADTLFSALCQEALKCGCLEAWYQQVRAGELAFSDAFPYMGKQLYLPKPYAWIENRERKGNSAEKKKLKKMNYIPVEALDSWFAGTYVPDPDSDLKDLGKSGLKVSAAIRGQEEPELYRVRYYAFHEGNGLYFIAGGRTEDSYEMLDNLISTLGYSGLGGKRGAGLGRFEYKIGKLPEYLEKRLNGDAGRYMLLSVALPKDEELPGAMDGANYQLVRRGGFVASETYADQQMRKRDLYVFTAGSCFGGTFEGDIYDVSCGGNHPVYRYARGMFMGVDV